MSTLSPERMKKILKLSYIALISSVVIALSSLPGCATRTDVFRDQSMDFGSIRTVAVMPLANYSRDQQASDRVRDVLVTDLLATGSIYVIPPGELARGMAGAGIANPAAPSVDEIVRLCRAVKADAVVTGSIREYGEIRSASAVSQVISLSMQMIEGQTGKIIWSASTTEGGISVKDRLLGGGGEPLNVITEKAVHDILTKLFE